MNLTEFKLRRIVNEELEILRGKKSLRWYAKFTAGWEALQNLTSVQARNSSILALDFEFNSGTPTVLEAHQGLVSKASTRPYQAAYQIQKGGKKQLFNHIIVLI